MQKQVRTIGRSNSSSRPGQRSFDIGRVRFEGHRSN